MGLLIFGIILFLLSSYLKAAVKNGTNEKANKGGMIAGIAGSAIRIIGIVLIVVGFLAATIIIVPTGSTAILMRFGAVIGHLNPGIHLIAPYINSTELMETRTQKELAQGTAASKDLQTVTAEIAINYHVDSNSAEKLYKNVGPDFKARVIDPAVQESLKQVTAQYTAEELIKKRTDVKEKVESEITKRVAAYGIVVEPLGVSITNFDFSPEFNAAIEQKQVAQQTAEKQKYVLQQAVLEKQTEITKAEGQAQASRIRALALKTQGGSRVIAEKWIDKWDGRLPTVSSGSSMMLNLSDMLKARESETGQ